MVWDEADDNISFDVEAQEFIADQDVLYQAEIFRIALQLYYSLAADNATGYLIQPDPSNGGRLGVPQDEPIEGFLVEGDFWVQYLATPGSPLQLVILRIQFRPRPGPRGVWMM